MIRVVFLLASALVVAALAATLFVIGGPEEARAERDDAERERELNILARQVDCNADAATLPDTLEEAAKCVSWSSRTDFLDPKTQEPYHFAVLADRKVEICVRFASRLYKENKRGTDRVNGYQRGELTCRSIQL
jgi:hypothetical protein